MMAGNAAMGELVDLVLKVGGAVSTALTILFGWLYWSLKKAVVTREDFSAWAKKHEQEHHDLEKRLADGDVRFTRMETTLTHMPTKDDVEDVRSEVAHVTGALQALGARMDGMGRSLDSIVDQLNVLITHHMK